jgi:hypothetical protein
MEQPTDAELINIAGQADTPVSAVPSMRAIWDAAERAKRASILANSTIEWGLYGHP